MHFTVFKTSVALDKTQKHNSYSRFKAITRFAPNFQFGQMLSGFILDFKMDKPLKAKKGTLPLPIKAFVFKKGHYVKIYIHIYMHM